MDGPQAPHHQMADDGEDIQAETQPKARPTIQNTTPVFIQHCFYLGKFNSRN